MLDDPDRFKHDRSAYERPSGKFRCGHEARWGTPCHRGPNADGSCGGTTECEPFKNEQGRFECRRPPTAGGPCSRGPNADGSCSQQHPPCQPTRSLRAVRGVLAAAALALVVGTIAILVASDAGYSGVESERIGTLNPINPGPLSARHARATVDQSCAACHVGHGGAAGWARALVTKADLSARCTACHAFEGPVGRPHNNELIGRAGPQATTCVMCHTEHKGATFQLALMSDQRCNICHTESITSFSTDHPPFPGTFPYGRRTALRFDHVSHFGKHFKRPKSAEAAPQSCTACHAITDSSQRFLTLRGYEQTCAACHNKDIDAKDLVLFRMPTLPVGFDRDMVLEACGPTLDAFEDLTRRLRTAEAGEATADPEAPADAEEFESISYEEPTRISALLLGVEEAEQDTDIEAITTLIMKMAKEGTGPLARLIDDYPGEARAEQLLAGLSPELVKRAACAWAANLEYESPADDEYGGWRVEYLDLLYTPMGHADPVVKAWIEFGLDASAAAADEAGVRRARHVRDELISSRKGVGRCTKCHAVTAAAPITEASARLVEWTSRGGTRRPYTFFSHGDHLNVLGGSQACTTCHVMNEEADYGAAFDKHDAGRFESNFHPIKRGACVQCHGGAGLAQQARGQHIREDCLLCHTYHRESTLTRPMTTLTDERTSNNLLAHETEDDTIPDS